MGMKWYRFHAMHDGEEMHEQIPADTMEEAAMELANIGYTEVIFESMHYTEDNETTVIDFIKGEACCFNPNIASM